MRVLCVDHGAVLRSYRDRYVAMARLDPDLDLTVVAPRGLRELNYLGQWDPPDARESGYRLVFTSFRPAKVHRGVFGPLRVARLLRELRPDVVQTQGEPEALSSGVLCALRDALAPASRFAFVSWSNLDVCRMGWPYQLPFLYDWSYRYVLRHGDAATVYCAPAEGILRANGFAGRIAQVPWGVDPDAFRRMPVDGLRASLGLRGLVLGFVGRLEPAKGVATLVRAAARCGVECSLLVVGGGPAQGAFAALARDLNVPARWAGRVGNSDLPRYLNCMDALVLPSETTRYWKEQFGKVLIEAMACEVPVIGSDSGEIPQVMGEAGLVFREKDADDLAARIAALADPAVRADRARLGRARALREYSWDSVARRTLAFYRDLLGAPGA